ncbi:BTAD domain-containing putative transcriptional regulator [Actinomadura craniellae]|nr:BTAD domain-containing putative transcriptional regulator [Actinomadura craniellae]
MVGVRVLGAFEAQVNGVRADLGGNRQRSVLARLVAAQGRMIPVDRLIEDLWPGEAPPRALVGVRTFISNLRRALEPDRPPRAAAQVLVTAPPGYALRLPADDVDAWRFEPLVRSAGRLLAERDAAGARAAAEEALALWRGPAYAEFVELDWAAAEAARLEELLRVAVERRAEAMLELAEPGEAVPVLEAHTAAHPLREDAWRLLGLALYRTGRQGDALAALRRARAALAEDLGVDPGPALQRLEADILAQSPALDHRPTAWVAPPPAAEPPPPVPLPSRGPLVGRDAESARLARAAAAAAAGRCALAMVTGEPGAGKTALVEHAVAELAAAGWRVATGRCPETEGAPAAWPWAELLRGLAAAAPPGEPLAARLAPLLDDAAPGSDGDMTVARFRLHRAVGDYLTELAERAPLLLVLDDLHRADDETLTLLTQLPTRLRDRRVLVVATFRRTEIPDPLADALAELARHEPVRIDLGGLAGPAVAELVRSVCTTEVDAGTVAEVLRRTGGNPFFVREMARLIGSAGVAAATSAVPAGVGEVLRRRVARLPAVDQTLLRYAAVMGRDLDPEPLAAAAGQAEDTVVDAIESALISGLVLETPDGRLRFAHALVRDTLYGDLSRLRRERMHARVAAALEERDGDAAALAHHYTMARTAPDRALRYARLAAERAEARFAHRTAAALWERALAAFDAAGGAAADRLGIIAQLVRTTALSGQMIRARAIRDEGIDAARAVGDAARLAEVVTAYEVPALWSVRPYGVLAHDVVAAAEEALRALPPGDGVPRARLLTVLAYELGGEVTDRGHTASLEAVEMARRLGRPDVLAGALNGRYEQSYRYGGHPERRRIGAEMLDLAVRHGLGVHQVVAHMILMEEEAAAFRYDRADEHAAAARRLGEQYEVPSVYWLGGWYHATRQMIAGEFEEAERLCRKVVSDLARPTMWGHEDASLWLALFCLRSMQGRLAELAAEVPRERTGWRAAGLTTEADALTLAVAGRPAEARALVADPPRIRPDWSLDIHATIRGRLGIALDDPGRVAEAYALLEPFPDHLVGDRTAACTLGPVTHVLGDFAARLGRPAEAAARYRHAVEISGRAGAPHWAAAAEAALARVERR